MMNQLKHVIRMKIVVVPVMVMNLYQMLILVFKKERGLPFFCRTSRGKRSQ